MDLSAAADSSVEDVGGKAAALGRLVRRGYNVPPGLVLTTEVHRASRAGGGALPEAIRYALVERWRATGWPKVAVRSSGVLEDRVDMSLAGQLETVLDVGNENALVAAIERVLASARSPRVIRYLEQRAPGLDPDLLLCACLVQRMLDPQCAGVAFGADPTSGSGDRLVIESVEGRAEPLVSGHIAPERHVLSRPDLLHLSSSRGEAGGFCLSPEDARRVAETVVRVEREFDGPQDVEWALVDGRVAVLQSRPVTALPDVPPEARALREEVERLRARHGTGPGLWTSFMAAELIPRPSIATVELLRAMGEPGSGGVLLAYDRDLGLGRVRHPIRIDAVCGRAYAEVGSVENILADLNLPVRLEAPGEGPAWSRMETSWVRVRWGRAAPAILGLAWRAFPVALRARRLVRNAAARFEGPDLAEIERSVAQMPGDLRGLDDASLLTELDGARSWCTGVGRRIWERGNIAALLSTALLQLRARLWLGDVDGTLAAALVRGAPGNLTLQANQAIQKLADVARAHGTASATFEDAFESFLSRYGHRATTELELSDPRWREDPGPIRASVARLVVDAPASAPGVRAEVGAAALLESVLSPLKGWRRRSLERAVTMARRNAYLRETPKFHYLRRLEQLRRLYLEVARRSMSRGGLERAKDVFQLQRVEIAAALDPSANRELGRVASARRRRRDQLVERHIPAFFRWDRLEEVLSSADFGAEDGSASQSGLLRGDGVSPGRVTGRARIVTDPGDARALGPDAVLVAPRADPGWTPLFIGVRAVVVETGSLISHSSIVAREYGLPMVVNVPHATRLREGVTLTVDGTEGWLRVEESDDNGHPGR